MNKLATAKNTHAADTYGLSLSPITHKKGKKLTNDGTSSDNALEALFILLIDVEWELMPKVGAGADE